MLYLGIKKVCDDMMKPVDEESNYRILKRLKLATRPPLEFNSVPSKPSKQSTKKDGEGDEGADDGEGKEGEEDENAGKEEEKAKKTDDDDDSLNNDKPKEMVTKLLNSKDLKAILSDSLFMTQFEDRVQNLLKHFSSEVLVVARQRKIAEVLKVMKIKSRVVRACRRRYPKTEMQFETWERAARRHFGISKRDIRNDDRKPGKYEIDDLPKAEDDDKDKSGDKEASDDEEPKDDGDDEKDDDGDKEDGDDDKNE